MANQFSEKSVCLKIVESEFAVWFDKGKSKIHESGQRTHTRAMVVIFHSSIVLTTWQLLNVILFCGTSLLCYVHVFVYCHLNSVNASVYLSVMYVCMHVSCVCWLSGFFLTFDLSGMLKRSVNLCIIFSNVLEIRWP